MSIHLYGGVFIRWLEPVGSLFEMFLVTRLTTGSVDRVTIVGTEEAAGMVPLGIAACRVMPYCAVANPLTITGEGVGHCGKIIGNRPQIQSTTSSAF
jgi:hypothetical protein